MRILLTNACGVCRYDKKVTVATGSSQAIPTLLSCLEVLRLGFQMSGDLQRRAVVFWQCAVCLITVFFVSMGSQNLPAAQVDPSSAQFTQVESQQPSSSETSYLSWIVHTSGWIGGLLLAMSLFLVSRVIECFMALRAQVVTPSDLIEEWEQLLKKRDVKGIYQSARESGCELGDLVATGLASISGGLVEAREAIDRMGETITVHMEKRISMLAVIGSLGPLIGLLGTLKGMISSFSVIARSETQMKASEVAGGISEALLITFEGVALSVPAIFFFAYFRNQISTLSLDAINQADVLIKRIYNSRLAASSAADAAKAEA